jgi:hypothetical protein
MSPLLILAAFATGALAAAYFAYQHGRKTGYRLGRWDGIEEGYADAMRDGWCDADDRAKPTTLKPSWADLYDVPIGEPEITAYEDHAHHVCVEQTCDHERSEPC